LIEIEKFNIIKTQKQRTAYDSSRIKRREELTMKRSKRYVAVFLASAMMVSALAGCGNSSGNSTAQNNASQTTGAESVSGNENQTDTTASGDAGSSVRIGISVDPGDLSPWPGNNNGRLTVLSNVYETLGQCYDDGTGMKNVLMKDCELQDDGYTYHITLYDNIYDTAGNHLTASDVEFSYLSAKEAGFLTPSKYIENITVLDDYTLDIEFNTQTVGDFENVLTQINVVTKAAYEASENQMITEPVGTGSYVVTNYVPGSSITLKNTGNYWQKDSAAQVNFGNVDEITYNFITEASQMAISLETDVIDVAVGVAADQMARFEDNNSDFGVSVTDDWQFYAMHFNMSDASVFADDLALRQAIAYAIDRQGILDVVVNGAGYVCKTFGTKNYIDANPKWQDDSYDYYNYDVDKAKEMLAQSKYQGQTLNILVSTNYAASVAEVVLSYLNAAGINATITQVETAVYNSTTKNDKSAWDIRIESFGSPFGYVASAVGGNFDQARYGDNYTTNFYVNDELQNLLHTAANVTTHNEETVEALQDYMKDNMISLPLVSFQAYSVFRKSVVDDLAFTVRGALLPGNCSYK
jgi:ABC-type transport system substrate-binding protein